MRPRSWSTRKLAALFAAAALGWLAWQSLWAHGGDAPLPWVDLTSRTLAQPARAGVWAFRTRKPLLRELNASDRLATVPAIDFSRHMAILVSSGARSSTAYRLEIVKIIEERRRILVVARERAPSLARPGAATLTFPFRLITIERRGKRVTLELDGRP